MANKYVRQGETYNGNGDASNAAASAGAAGAYNSVLDCLKQTAGYTVSAGDVVRIKTTNEATEDFTITISASTILGHASGAIWIFDDGTTWVGAAGVITLDVNTNGALIRFSALNQFFGNHRLSMISYAAFSSSLEPVSIECLINGIDFDVSACTASNQYGACVEYGGLATVIDCSFKFSYGNSGGAFNSDTISSSLILVNSRIELTQAIGNPVFRVTTNGTSIFAYGGEIYGAGAVAPTIVASLLNTSGSIVLSGMKYPRTMVARSSSEGGRRPFISNGADGGMGSSIAGEVFECSSRNDGNFPTLNAVLPDSASTPWSYKLYPHSVARAAPAFLSIGKLWTQATAVKTVALNFLSHDDMAAPTTENCWMEVEYKDADGHSKSVSTFDIAGTALGVPVIGVGWSDTTYGAEFLTKRQLQVTTPTAVAQDTVINVMFFTTITSSVTTQVMFVCPDPVLS